MGGTNGRVPGADVDAASGATGRGRDGRPKVRSGRDDVRVGEGSADLRLVEQLVDGEQTAAIAQMVRLAFERGLLDGGCTPTQVAEAVFAEFEEGGWEALAEHGYAACGLALPRPHEFEAALARWRP